MNYCVYVSLYFTYQKNIMFKFIKNMYTIQTDSVADFVLSMILWIVTVIGIPYGITSILRQFAFSYKTQVNIAIGVFVIMASIALMGISKALQSDMDHKRGFYDKDN